MQYIGHYVCSGIELVVVVSDKTEHGLIVDMHLITQIIW